MSFFDGIKKMIGIRPPLTMDDPVFGKILYCAEGWEGKVDFAPVGEMVEVIIEANESGPNDKQREWMKSLQSNYLSAIPSIVDTIWTEIHEWNPEITKESIPDLIKLEGIGIARCDSQSCFWDVTFVCDAIEHHIAIGFSGMTVINAVVDG